VLPKPLDTGIVRRVEVLEFGKLADQTYELIEGLWQDLLDGQTS